MAKTVFKAEMDKWPEDQAIKTHNRWHPDIPITQWFKPGDEFRVECYDWTGGQIKNDDSANDIRDVDLSKVHYLSGPFGVEGAEPGDLLVVDINDIGWLEDSQWGFTGIFALENGGGFLDKHFPHARKSCWDFHGVYTTSRHIPGVRFPGLIHPGLIGTLPSGPHAQLESRRQEMRARATFTAAARTDLPHALKLLREAVALLSDVDIYMTANTPMAEWDQRRDALLAAIEKGPA